MQKKIYLITLILTFNISLGQINSYRFTQENTKENIEPAYKNGYYIYQVEKKELQIPIYDSIEKPSEEYYFLENQIKQKTEDSIAYVTKFNKHKEINVINVQISNFFASSAKLKTKKHFLINAQEIADKYSLPYLLYADKEFNANKIKEFKEVSGNLSDHLLNIMIEITAKYDLEENSSIFQSLKSTRLRFKTTNKTEIDLVVVDSVKLTVVMQDERLKEFENISGTFDILGEHSLLKEDQEFGLIRMYRGQLVNSDSLRNVIGRKNVENFGFSYILIKNRDKEEYYTTNYEFLREFGIDNKIDDYMSLLKKNGYTSTLNGDILYINTSKGKVRATYDIYEQVQANNFNYIEEVSKSIVEFKNLVRQANQLTEKLANHFSAHRNFTMTDSRLNTWKNDTRKSQSLLDKMKSLKGNEEDISDYFLRKIDEQTTKEYIEFLEVLNGTKVVLGM